MKISSVFLVAFILLFLYIYVVKPPAIEMFDPDYTSDYVTKDRTYDHASPPKCQGNADNSKKCSAGCSENDDLLPVLNPMFNMREICKQSILLEDHLFQTRKRCQDCVKKHLLTIEALAEEAITLDKEGVCKEYYSLPDKVRDLQKQYIKGENPNVIAQQLRGIRKKLMEKCFESF